MSQNPSIIPSVFAGALAGAVVTAVILQSPNLRTRLTNDAPRNQGQQTDLPPAAQATSHEEAIVRTVQNAQDSVVSIVITKDVPIIERFYQDVPGNFFNPFGDFFGASPFGFRIPQERQNGTERREIGGGSGFVITADGMIVTNRHVVSDTEADYTVFLTDGTKHDAEVIARDPVNDIALLKINASGLSHLEFADSDELLVGQTVIAIGNALGEFKNTVSTGVVSGLSRSITAGSVGGQPEQLDEVIQTDAAINPGNSGGPLLDLTGKVIGVNVAVALGSENIGFALPANIVKSVVESVQETGRISRPYLGVRYTQVTPALQEANNLPVDYGVLVIRGEDQNELAVQPGSPANKAGIQEGDIILEIDGQRLNEERSLASTIRNKQVGEQVELKVLSRGEEKTVQVTLEEFPE